MKKTITNHYREKINVYRIPRPLVFFALFLTTLLLQIGNAVAQAPTITIPYPVAAQSLSRTLDTGFLTAQINFTAACPGTTVTISFPASVSYVPGSVVATASSAGFSITQNNITNLSIPVFNIVAPGAGSITFRVKRSAECGTLSSGKDTVRVTGGCGTVADNSSTVNTYNLLSPSLSLTAPVAINNAVLGTTATRTFTVTNGGNGCTDTARLFIVYPGGGIVNTNSNKITIGSIAFSPSSTNGDTLFYKIYGATIFGGNNLFCNGETISVSEPIRIASCDVTTTYGAYWSKGTASACQLGLGTSSISMATGTPNVWAINEVVISRSNMCDSALVEFSVKNNGTQTVAGAGTAFNLLEQFGINNNVLGMRGQQSMSKVILFNNTTSAWIPVVQTGGVGAVVSLAFSQFATDPDGVGGLIDADGDGLFNDLPVGAQIKLRVKVGFVCTPGCNSANHSGNTVYQSFFDNQCGVAQPSGPVEGGFSQADRGTSVLLTGPVDMVDGQVVTIRLNGAKVLGAGSFNCPTNQLRWKIAVPKGTSLIDGRFYVNTSTNVETTLGTNTITGPGSYDTLVIIGQIPATSDYSSYAYEADLKYISAGASSGPISYTVSYVCDAASACQCVETWNCGTIPMVLHGNGSCPGGGLTMTNSAMLRTTGGYTSPTASTFVNVSTLPLKQLRYLTPYDSSRGTFTGTLYAGANTFTNNYFQLSYTAPGGNKALQPYSGTLKIYNKITHALKSTCVVASPLTDAIVSGTHTIAYNLTSCGIVVGDSIIFQPNFLVMPNASYAAIPTALTNVATKFYSTAGSATQYSCDGFSAEMYFNQTLPSMGGAVAVINGCTTYNSPYTNFGPVALAYDIYPGEIRSAFILDSVVVNDLNNDIITSTSMNLYSYGPAAEGYTAATYLTTTVTPTFRNNRRTAVIVNPGTWPKGENGYSILVSSTTNCETISPGTLNTTYYYKNYGFSHNPAVYSPTSIAGNIPTSGFRATLSLTDNTGIVQGVLPQQFWDVQINNPSTVAAPYIWMALEKGSGSGNISIDSVVLKPSNTIIASAGTYDATSKWYKVSTAGLAGTTSQAARIYFRYNSCSADSILLRAAWNCTGYPTPDPNAYPCTPVEIYLSVMPQPSQIQLTVSRQPGNGSSTAMCATDSALILINSAQSANLINPYINIYPPAGTTLTVPLKVEFPLASGTYYNITPTAISGGYKVNLNSIPAIAASGIPGTTTSAAANARQAKLKVIYTTNCSAVSGSTFSFYGFGEMPCGAEATGDGTSLQTGGMTITGASTPGSVGLTVAVALNSVNCGQNSVLSARVIPVTLPTQAGDTAIYTLPKGLSYNGGFTSVKNCTTCNVTSSIDAQGNTLVKIAMQPAIAAGDSVKFSFNVITTGAGSCGSVSVAASMKRSIGGLFCGSTPCVGSSAIIGNGTSPVVVINKPNIIINSVLRLANSTWTPGGIARIAINYTNKGTMAATANSITAEFFCGSSVTPFASKTLTKALAINGNGIDTFALNIPAANTCNIRDLITTKIQATTNTSVSQCICNAQSFILTGQPLPVTFISSTATAEHCMITLGWEYAATGVSVTGFTIERSQDGAKYSKAGSVSANTNTYTDVTAVAGSWFYRIAAAGSDGKDVYSKTMAVSTSQCTTNMLNIFPNPATKMLQVALQGSNGVDGISYTLYNILGQGVQQGLLSNNSINRLNISDLATGVYSMRILWNGVVYNEQVRIQQ